jgi:hypothetical protein
VVYVARYCGVLRITDYRFEVRYGTFWRDTRVAFESVVTASNCDTLIKKPGRSYRQQIMNNNIIQGEIFA